MEEFCGSEFWNSSLTWYAESQPDFTPCFEKTVLVWIPCVYLWIFAPFQTQYLIKCRDRNVPWSLYNISKIIISSLLIIDLCVLLFMNVSRNNSEIDTVFGADILAPCLLIISIIMQLIFVIMEKQRGVQSTGYLFIYWLLMMLCGLPGYRTHFLYIDSLKEDPSSYGFIVYMIYYPLVVFMLGLNCFADKRPQKLFYSRGDNACPEYDAPFISIITFSWLDGLVWKGYRQPITQNMLWDLPYENSSKKITKDWDHYWDKDIKKSYKKGESHTRATFTKDKHQVQVVGTAGDKSHYVSILPTMIKTFGLQFLFGSFLKLIHDLLQFASPQIISLLIAFTEDKTQPMWRGYLYAVLLFAVTQIQSLFLGQYFIRMFLVGLKIRTAIIAVVYKKALRVSNSARKESTVGEIVNLMSVDAQRFMDLITYLNMIWSAPLQIALCLYFLWQILGPSVLAGLAVMIILIPINGFIANQQKKLQISQMKQKDLRVKLMNEILNGIRVLKLYAWEPSFEDTVMNVRGKEIKVLKKAAYLNAGTSFIWTCAPFLVTFAIFATYVMSSPEHILTPTNVFVSIALLNIMRMPMSILPMLIVSGVQVSLASFAVFVVVSDTPFDSKKAFVSITLFNLLRFPIAMLPMLITNAVQASVSLKRMNKFVNSDELDPSAVSHQTAGHDPITVDNGTFSWGHGEEDKPILKGISFKAKEGSLVGVVGAVGAGKSSLCSAILGEMEKDSGSVILKGKVAYVPQQAWIQNATLENNVTFGKEKDNSFYKKVIDSCALKSDFDMLPAGDQTEIGEKGINLSGGQKQRVNLARAVYSDADVYLLDDPLSAVDAHVGKHIFENVIGPQGLLQKKTRLLVTHGLTYLRQMDQIIVLKNGEISEKGTYPELLAKKGEFQEFILQYLTEEMDEEENIEELEELKLELEKSIGREVLERQISQLSRKRRDSERSFDSKNEDDFFEDLENSLEKSIENSQRKSDERKSQNGTLRKRIVSESERSRKLSGELLKKTKVGEKLIETEKAETGGVSMNVYSYYIRAIGIIASVVTVIFYAASQGFSVGSNIWLAKWSQDNSSVEPAVRNKYLGVYGGLGVLQAITVVLGFIIIARASIVGSKILHNKMLWNVLRSPMTFFDMTPIGRVVNRFSKDIDTIDVLLPMNLRMLILCSIAVISTLAVIIYATPIFVAVMIPALAIYYFAQLVYVATSRQLKRIESISRSPIYSHFGETVQGAQTIRAYDKANEFILDSEKKVDYNQVSYYPSIVANRWLAIRLEFIGNILTFSAALFAVMSRDTITGGEVGLSISYALSVTQTLNWLVRMTSDVETNIVAVERVKEYTETPQEAAWEVPEKKPPKTWPDNGVVKFENYSTRYREGLDLVVKGISCEIKSNEKVGIVGRTGAGKSSLTLALFRIIEPAGGKIIIDNVDVANIGLHDLRGKLTIIPQDPVLFSGTLRMNLDPFNKNSDQAVWDALEHSHLKEFVSALGSKLQHEISEGGDNLSVGQRQLICLARALLRKSKVLILDEATAAIDMETDDLIQETIRREFSDCTIITIAHRLNTIMDSTRVLVMDRGEIHEFDTPSNLLKNKKSIFYGMAKDAGII